MRKATQIDFQQLPGIALGLLILIPFLRACYTINKQYSVITFLTDCGWLSVVYNSTTLPSTAIQAANYTNNLKLSLFPCAHLVFKKQLHSRHVLQKWHKPQVSPLTCMTLSTSQVYAFTPVRLYLPCVFMFCCQDSDHCPPLNFQQFALLVE